MPSDSFNPFIYSCTTIEALTHTEAGQDWVLAKCVQLQRRLACLGRVHTVCMSAAMQNYARNEMMLATRPIMMHHRE